MKECSRPEIIKKHSSSYECGECPIYSKYIKKLHVIITVRKNNILRYRKCIHINVREDEITIHRLYWMLKQNMKRLLLKG